MRGVSSVAGAGPGSIVSPGRAALPARLGTAAFVAWQGAVVVLLMALAATSAIGYDEDQYVAAGVLARHLRPYADFVYLQPPLYPLLLAAVFGAADGHYVLAGRALTWALSVASCGALLGVLFRLGAGRASAAALVSACLASPFLIGPVASTRNDILPLCLFLLGLGLYLRAEQRGRAAFAAAGLFFGLAVMAKLSYAFGPPVVLAHAFLAGGRGRVSLRARAAPLAAGLCAAASPALYYLWIAPEGFLYGLLEYHLTAPIAWYTQEGQADSLRADARADLLAQLLFHGSNGILVVLAVLLALLRWTRRHEPVHHPAGDAAPPRLAEGLVLGLLAGALVCGFLPRPSWPQYYAPLAPLLACWIAAQQTRVRASGPRWILPFATAAAALSTALSLGPWADALAKLPRTGEWAGVSANRNAVAVRETVRRAGGGEGDVATLFPTLVMDANPVRPEFASGPFFFRTSGALPPERVARLRGTGPHDLERLFAADPPAAIFAGVHAARWRAPMDAALVAYAERHGYALAMSGASAAGATGGRLYVRPSATPAPRRVEDAPR